MGNKKILGLILALALGACSFSKEEDNSPQETTMTDLTIFNEDVVSRVDVGINQEYKRFEVGADFIQKTENEFINVKPITIDFRTTRTMDFQLSGALSVNYVDSSAWIFTKTEKIELPGINIYNEPGRDNVLVVSQLYKALKDYTDATLIIVDHSQGGKSIAFKLRDIPRDYSTNFQEADNFISSSSIPSLKAANVINNKTSTRKLYLYQVFSFVNESANQLQLSLANNYHEFDVTLTSNSNSLSKGFCRQDVVPVSEKLLSGKHKVYFVRLDESYLKSAANAIMRKDFIEMINPAEVVNVGIYFEYDINFYMTKRPGVIEAWNQIAPTVCQSSCYGNDEILKPINFRPIQVGLRNRVFDANLSNLEFQVYFAEDIAGTNSHNFFKLGETGILNKTIEYAIETEIVSDQNPKNMGRKRKCIFDDGPR